jgi:hypothetical protein
MMSPTTHTPIVCQIHSFFLSISRMMGFLTLRRLFSNEHVTDAFGLFFLWGNGLRKVVKFEVDDHKVISQIQKTNYTIL